MSTINDRFGKRVTFRELFDYHPNVEIPIIQRDYAQGRDTALELRTAFLDAIHSALSKEPAPTLPLDLDFVYGTIEGQRPTKFCPLDGQQRLTTLFLLHWYLAWRDGQSAEFSRFAAAGGKSKFAYAVRPSSGEFLDRLVNWVPEPSPEEVEFIRDLIEDQPWFFQRWKGDPSIQSALAMLEAMHVRFHLTAGLYRRLIDVASPRLTFQLLNLENFGLTDDLYIKMNARGKLLTSFETFKALVEKRLGETFAETDARELNGRRTTVKDYFSHKIDAEWAEWLWAYRDQKSNLFDGRLMNLIRALAIISRDPEADEVENVLKELNDATIEFSFQKYLDANCLDRSHVELLMTLLDSWCGSTSGMRTYLPDGRHYDEERAIRRILERGGSSTYAELVLFRAYAGFIHLHGESLDGAQFSEWMRVVRNLTVNSNIERPAQFRGVLRSMIDLVPNANQVLSYLAEGQGKLQVFSGQQSREERIKAALILKSERWKQAVLNAEQHGYFNSQIEFLLDFCGILEAWKKSPNCDWTSTEDDAFFTKFTEYARKARMLFNDGGLISHGDFRTERALLAMGDYLFENGKNKSFLENVDYPISWKRLLRGEDLQHAGARRGYVKQLLDALSDNGDVRQSLDHAIAAANVSDEWRSRLVRNQKLLEFCEKRQIRLVSPTFVYLLKGVRRSRDHTELFTYDLYLGLLRRKNEREELVPFGDPTHVTVRGDEGLPYIKLSCMHGEDNLVLQMWNNEGRFRLRMYLTPGAMPADLQQDLESEIGCTPDNHGRPCVDVDRGKIESILNRIVDIVRKYVPV